MAKHIQLFSNANLKFLVLNLPFPSVNRISSWHPFYIYYILGLWILSAIKKKEWNIAICSNIDGPRGYTYWSKSDRERNIVSLICGILNSTNECIQNRKNLTDAENKFMVTKEGKEVGMDKLGMWD